MPDIKKLLKIIKKREAVINDVPQEFINSLESIQNKIYSELLVFVKELDVKSGKALQNNEFNVKLALGLRDQIRTWLRDNGYYQRISDFGRKYNDLIKLSDEYFRGMNIDGTFSERDLQTLSQIKKDDLNFLYGRDRDVINTTYNEVISSIYSKSDWRQLASRLKDIHTDTVFANGKTLNGLLKKYSSTYAFTAYSGFDRRIQTMKANEHGLDYFYYSGSLVNDSREFCVSRVGKVFTRKEVEQWQNMSWNGKAAGRDVWVYLGGFNCQHILSPVTEEFAKELQAG